MVKTNAFPKSIRLSGHDVFGPVIRRGGCAADATLVAHARPNRENLPRFGITIPRRTGNAVVRNRWKRHIREALRHCRHDVPQGFDYVIRPKKNAKLAGKQIRKGIFKLLSRAAKRSGAASGKSDEK